MPNISVITVTIASGASLSGAVQCGTLTPVGIVMPAAWTTAGLAFAVSDDQGTTYRKMLNQAGTEVTTTAPAADDYIALSPTDFGGVRDFKIRSGTNASPVNQGAARTLKVVCVQKN